MNLLVIRLHPGDDLRESLEQLGLQAGCIVSGIGSLTQAVLRFAGRDEGTVIGGPLEVIALAGTIGPDGAHVHASVADADGVVRGGHVMKKCVVRTTAEIVVAQLPGWEFRREFDARTGSLELVVRGVEPPRGQLTRMGGARS